MSLCYADALSPYEDKGKVGMPEIFDSPDLIEQKCRELADLLKHSKCCFVIAGAGISTSAGIADFRGPTGVWTLEKQGKSAVSVDFSQAIPTPTHMALVALEAKGIVKYLVSQNVDGLTPRSGFPLNRLAELHGNVYCEYCERCYRRYYREFIVGSVGLKPTGRSCEGTTTGRPCRGRLIDSVLDWESALPEPEFSTSNTYAKNSDVILCLGTSLQIVPVGDMPLMAKRRGGKIITVNLQATKHEKKVDLAIHGKVDQVMQRVLELLEIPEMKWKSAEIFEKSSHPLEVFEKPKRVNKRKSSTSTKGEIDETEITLKQERVDEPGPSVIKQEEVAVVEKKTIYVVAEEKEEEPEISLNRGMFELQGVSKEQSNSRFRGCKNERNEDQEVINEASSNCEDIVRGIEVEAKMSKVDLIFKSVDP